MRKYDLATGNQHSLRFVRSLALLSATGALACSTPPTLPDGAVREAGLADQSMVADAELDSSDGAIASIGAAAGSVPNEEAGLLFDASGPETYGPFPDGTVCNETDGGITGFNAPPSLLTNRSGYQRRPRAPVNDGTCCSVAGLYCTWAGGPLWACHCTATGTWSCHQDIAGPGAPPELALNEYDGSAIDESAPDTRRPFEDSRAPRG